MKRAAKAVSDKDVKEFLAMAEAAPVRDVTRLELDPGDPESCGKIKRD